MRTSFESGHGAIPFADQIDFPVQRNDWQVLGLRSLEFLPVIAFVKFHREVQLSFQIRAGYIFRFCRIKRFSRNSIKASLNKGCQNAIEAA